MTFPLSIMIHGRQTLLENAGKTFLRDIFFFRPLFILHNVALKVFIILIESFLSPRLSLLIVHFLLREGGDDGDVDGCKLIEFVLLLCERRPRNERKLISPKIEGKKKLRLNFRHRDRIFNEIEMKVFRVVDVTRE